MQKEAGAVRSLLPITIAIHLFTTKKAQYAHNGGTAPRKSFQAATKLPTSKLFEEFKKYRKYSIA